MGERVLIFLTALTVLGALSSACATADAPTTETTAAQIPERTKEQKVDLGRQHKTAWDLYQALRKEANGGQRLVWNNRPTGAASIRGRPTRVLRSIPTSRSVACPLPS
jgi:hypothetical protein